MLKLHNTLSNRTEELNISAREAVRLYTCGPTVYDFAHIGNLRSYITADVLRRVLELNKYTVCWVVNITDVDDKTIRQTVSKYGSQATVDNLRELTTAYFDAFRQNLAEVNVPESRIRFIRVSDVIPEITIFILELLRRGYAYQTEDGVYFSIAKYQAEFGDYGELVGREFLAGQKIGARVKVDEYKKENLSDFALWKTKNPADGNIFWTDSIGRLPPGRPGWHIECSAINQTAFAGETTHIHTGGVDLIFPHHTNEIAQSTPLYAPSGRRFVRNWCHSEHLLVNGCKMAKRENNFYTLADLQKETAWPGLALRYLALQTHYRTQMNFTWESMHGAYNSLSNLYIRTMSAKDEPSLTLQTEFREVLNNDLNTPQALAFIHEVVLKKQVSPRWFLDQLGLLSGAFSPVPVPQTVLDLVAERQKYRGNKQFVQADALRQKINELGYIIEDTAGGPLVYPSI